MGILNTTPDSFYQQGGVLPTEEYLLRAESMLEQGATIIDIGGVSTRPGASVVSESEEAARVLPVVEALRKQFPEAILSIDTFRSGVALQAIAAGIDMINDIYGGRYDDQMFNVVIGKNIPYILMHMQGEPSSMQQAPQYTNVVSEVAHFFENTLGTMQQIADSLGSTLPPVLLDPGFGFGKTLEHNYRLLGHLQHLSVIPRPFVVGVSRKSMIQKVVKVNTQNALNGTTALHMIALQQGAHVLRVHDVKEAMECIRIYEFMKQHNPE